MSNDESQGFEAVATVKVKMPLVPNYLIFETIKGKISIADVPVAQLRSIGEAWTDRLVERAREIRANRDAGKTSQGA